MPNAFIRYNGKTIEAFPNKFTYEEELYVDYKITIEEGKRRFQLHLHPKQKITLESVSIQFPHPYQADFKIFCNGFQSWTESREYALGEKIKPLRRIARPLMKNYGDYHFEDLYKDKNQFHSWTYSYIRLGFKNMYFLGSLNESTGFTIIRHDSFQHQISVEKDCKGLELEHSYLALDLFEMRGEDRTVFGAYFAEMGLEESPKKSTIGWTSWYNYYTNISEEIILGNLQHFLDKEQAIDIFQIDDGFQQSVGDWLDIKPNFPKGMAHLAEAIQSKGIKAGLWLAPFVCEKKSKIFQEKKGWLLKDEKGKPVVAGYTPLWGGWFYALDFYHAEVQEYLSGVFHTVLEKWGYDMVKLDFLYAVALRPRKNKTRGQIMHEAMSFLRGLVGDKLILGCGVPLGSSFGLVDFCRIGADIHLKWEHRLLKWLRNRERVSTLVALRSVLGRWQLSLGAFENDPDVFLLRDSNLKLTLREKRTVLIVNTLLGKLLFTSDDISEYNDAAWKLQEELDRWKDSRIQYVDQRGWIYHIYFENKAQHFCAMVNLGDQAAKTSFNNAVYLLEAHETLVKLDQSLSQKGKLPWENKVY